MHKSSDTQASFRLSVLLLGLPQLLLNEHPLDALRRKNRALVYWIAARAQPVTREQVLTLFWPDYDRSAAQTILRSMLHELRKQLGPSLVIEGETLALASDAEVDGLSVVDASIMAVIPCAPTNLATIMIAERCAAWLMESG
jgi:DNA-binding SARP family transcriptional activator